MGVQKVIFVGAGRIPARIVQIERLQTVYEKTVSNKLGITIESPAYMDWLDHYSSNL